MNLSSAHDLRRSFGFRWADLVKPKVLQQWMRHDDITTSFEYYLVADEDDTAEAIWNAFEARNRTIPVPMGSDEPFEIGANH
jgi:integrase